MLGLVKEWWPIVAAAIGGLCIAFTYFSDRKRKKTGPPSWPQVQAGNGGVAIGGNARENKITTSAPPRRKP